MGNGDISDVMMLRVVKLIFDFACCDAQLTDIGFIDLAIGLHDHGIQYTNQAVNNISMKRDYCSTNLLLFIN